MIEQGILLYQLTFMRFMAEGLYGIFKVKNIEDDTRNELIKDKAIAVLVDRKD